MLDKRKQALRERLKDPDENVRQAAARALEDLESAMDLEKLLEILKMGTRGQKVKALFALERINTPEVFPPLLAALTFPDEDIRATAIQVLGAAEAVGAFSDARLIPYLVGLLTEQDAELVKSAIRSLGTIGRKDAEAPLLEMLNHAQASIRLEAALALGKLEL
ncbi:MAG: HEAT repeat domain-containing protein [Desulfuromonadaceae bacterium]